MKILYCLQSTCNSGGMERILSIKANFLSENLGYDVYIVTTDQKAKANFYYYSPKIKFIDLSVNYDELLHMNIFYKFIYYIKKKKCHKKRLQQTLHKCNFDIVVSMFGREIGFLWKFKDGSKKILELHFSKNVKIQRKQSWINKFINKFIVRLDEYYASRYDKFVVLTREDMKSWTKCRNIICIPNPSFCHAEIPARLDNNTVIAVGRLCYQKGFDMLIDIWQKVHDIAPNWRLKIYGEGEQKDALIAKLKKLQLESVIEICPPTIGIMNEYMRSSIFVFSSRYEGFGLALIEAMSCGLPVVSFACKCGPRDLIKDGDNGFLVEEFDIRLFSEKIIELINNYELRKRMGLNAYLFAQGYKIEIIMKQWDLLFQSVVA